MDFDSVIALAVGTLGGAAIGLERQWSGHATGPHARFGGIRTFTLLGGLAALAGWLSQHGFTAPAVILLAAPAALIAIGYAAASRHDIDATTEVAAVVVLAAGTLAGAGYLALSSAVIAGTAVLLLEKTRLHALVSRIDDASLRASVRFAAMACILLPLLPAGPYGPLGVFRPRELWALVLFFSGLSFVGWVARRMIGAHEGAIVAGLLGGVISSTSVTLRFAQDSRKHGGEALALAAGAIGASTVMLVRVGVACAVLNPGLAMTLPWYLAPAFVLGAVSVLTIWRRATPDSNTNESSDGSPLQLRAALQMTAMFQGVLILILLVQQRWGSQALIATSAIVGLTDLDALTLSLARGATAGADLDPVTTALVTGVIANTVLKLTVAVAVGQKTFRTTAGLILGGMVVVTSLALVMR